MTKRSIAWLNNPEVVRFSEQRHKTHTLETCSHYMESFEGSPHFFWAIVTNEGRLGHIGNINAYMDVMNRVADIGVLIGETKSWGKGYATEAFGAVCRYLLDVCGMRKVTAGTISSNVAMIRVMQKSGMVDDGVRRRHYFWEGKEVDVIHMALFADGV